MPSDSNRDIDIPALLVIGIVSGLLLYEIVVGTMAWFYYALDQERLAKSTDAMNPVIRQEMESQKQRLHEGYAWVSQEDGVVRIPVDRAMDQWLQEHHQAGPASQAPAAD